MSLHMAPSKGLSSSIYRFAKRVVGFQDAMLERAFPEQYIQDSERDLNNTINTVFPNGVCQDCVYSKRGYEQ